MFDEAWLHRFRVLRNWIWRIWKLIGCLTFLLSWTLIHLYLHLTTSIYIRPLPVTRIWQRHHGPLTRYVKLRVAHAPGMPGMFSPPPRISYPDMHHGTCVTHVPWYMPRSLTSGWREKKFPAFPAHAQPQFYVSGKRPMTLNKSPRKERISLLLLWS